MKDAHGQNPLNEEKARFMPGAEKAHPNGSGWLARENSPSSTRQLRTRRKVFSLPAISGELLWQGYRNSIDQAIHFMPVRAAEDARVGDSSNELDWRLVAFLAEFPFVSFGTAFVFTSPADFIDHRFATFGTVHGKLLVMDRGGINGFLQLGDRNSETTRTIELGRPISAKGETRIERAAVEQGPKIVQLPCASNV
jgi:hypothetical protein